MAHQPTQSDVARAAGVSRGLVSLALSGSAVVSETTRERILAAARELGYTRDLGAASLAKRRSPVLGVVLPDLRNPFFEEVLSVLQPQAESQDLLPLTATSSNDPERERLILRRFRELRVFGVVIVSPVEPLAELEQAAAATPMVLIGADVDSATLNAVHVDEDAAARLLVAHVVARGWDSVISLADHGSAGGVWVERRQRALQAAAVAAGLPFRRARDQGEAGIATLLRELFAARDAAPPRPAVVAHNDMVASNALAVLRSLGLTPGRDIALIGFDDTYLARRPEFDITSVSQDCDLLVSRAMAALRATAAVGPGTPPARARQWAVAPTLSVRSTS